jgi:hypothetical protein
MAANILYSQYHLALPRSLRFQRVREPLPLPLSQPWKDVFQYAEDLWDFKWRSESEMHYLCPNISCTKVRS